MLSAFEISSIQADADYIWIDQKKFDVALHNVIRRNHDFTIFI